MSAGNCFFFSLFVESGGGLRLATNRLKWPILANMSDHLDKVFYDSECCKYGNDNTKNF